MLALKMLRHLNTVTADGALPFDLDALIRCQAPSKQQLRDKDEVGTASMHPAQYCVQAELT